MENTSRGNTTTNSGMSDKSEGMLNRASSTAHAAVNSITGAVEEATRKVKPAIDGATAIAHQAVDKAAGAATQVADWSANQAERLTDAERQLRANTTSYISANPLKSVGIAFVAGLLLSRMLLQPQMH